MLRIVIGGLFFVSVVGCNRAEKHSLRQFLISLEASLGHPYEYQLKGIVDPERNVRFRMLFARDQLITIDAYLATQPPLGTAARGEVNGFRTVKAAELKLYERLLTERRYELTEVEKKLDAELSAQAQRNIEEIGRLVDK